MDADNGAMRGFLLDLLFPAIPLGHGPADRVGEEFRAHPLRFEGHLLPRRGLPSIDVLVCGGSYASSPELREAIRRFKYRRIESYGVELGRMLAETSAFLRDRPSPVLCPVPLHWTRRFFRGFNQAEALARSVADARGWPVAELLRRVRPTGSQAKRSHAERRTALRDAFAWNGDGVPARVVLVDDVVTSGATLEACAAALRGAGVAHVDAITLAVALP